jgi:hypothetical protein
VRLSIALLAVGACYAQALTQRGYVETRGFLYPQTVPGDSGQAVGESVLDYEVTYRVSPSFRFSGEVEAQTDTHNEAGRAPHLSWQDRELQRPAFAVRRLSASYSRGLFAIEIGKQVVRWGKADILNPTDHFAPRDFVNPIRSEFLSVSAARLTYGNQSNRLEIVAVPLFTPSRTPLLNQRWGSLPVNLPVANLPAQFPGGMQTGGRWNHIGQSAEFSLSYFDGFSTLPLIHTQLLPSAVPTLGLQRFFPRIRSYGADLAVPLHAVTLKGEAAYFDSRTKAADQYLLYVVQLERQSGEWSFVGGYAGQVVTRATPTPVFDPDRGLTRAFLGRAGYTIDSNRNVSVEGAVRENGKGILVKAEYSQAFRGHWRATVGAGLIRGDARDYFGQYRRNSYANLALRYSF